MASAGDSPQPDEKYFERGLRIGLGRNDRFNPSQKATWMGYGAGTKLRKKALAGKTPQGLKFKIPTDFGSWISAYQGAIAHNDQCEQEMLLAALGCRVSIKTKEDYVKPK